MYKTKNFIKQILNSIELLYMYYDDYYRFRKYNFNKKLDKLNKKQLESRLIKTYHSIEKGLSCNKFRYGFGESNIVLLINLLKVYEKKYGVSDVFNYSISTLNNYLTKHSENIDFSTVAIIRSYLNLNKIDVNENKSTKKLTKKEIIESSILDFKSFANSRHSVRDYTDSEVPNELIIDAIEIALKTPSVCNRQGWKVRILQKAEYINALRENQNGNQNWGHLANKYLVITHDINSLNFPRERNQGYVDGGLFAMSLLYALHSKGIATCSLSASISRKQNSKLRKKINISNKENIIMFISVGNYKDEFIVPSSKRLETEAFYEIL